MTPEEIRRSFRHVGLFLSAFGFAAPVLAADVTLAWDANREANVTGYVVAIGTRPGVYDRMIDVGNQTRYVVAGLTNGQQYYFAVRAYNSTGLNSDFSSEVTTAVAPVSFPFDMDSDGNADLLFQSRTDGWLAVWRLRAGIVLGGVPLNPNRRTDLSWIIVGDGDFDADGHRDILWQNRADGRLEVWLMSGGTCVSTRSIGSVSDLTWRVVGVADMNGDGWPDIIWQQQTEGWLAIWRMQGTTVAGGLPLSTNRAPDPNWKIVAVADLDGDAQPDFLWRYSDGSLATWKVDQTGRAVGNVPLSPNARIADPAWRVAGVMDLDGDGQNDILWRHEAEGWLAVWRMSQGTLLGGLPLQTNRVDPSWVIAGTK